MEGTGHDHPITGAADRKCQGLIPVRRASDRESARIRPPQMSSPPFRLSEHPALQLHRVQTTEQRYITPNDLPDEITSLLVTWRRERLKGTIEIGQIGIKQRGLTTKAERVRNIPDAHAADPIRESRKRSETVLGHETENGKVTSRCRSGARGREAPASPLTRAFPPSRSQAGTPHLGVQVLVKHRPAKHQSRKRRRPAKADLERLPAVH
jgi:hypothetical protein